MNTLGKQYKMVQGSREVLFNYLSTIPFAKLHVGISTVENRSICYLLNHTGMSYLSWLNEFARQIPLLMADETAWETMEDIKAFYTEVDDAVYNFLGAFDNEDQEITGLKKRQNMVLTLSILELFTHVITHEFHHKGVIVNMTRQLGFVPVDTDIIRF